MKYNKRVLINTSFFVSAFFGVFIFMASCQLKEQLLKVELQTYQNSFQYENKYFPVKDTVFTIPKLEEGESHFYQNFSFKNSDPKKGFDFSAINQNPIKKIKLKAGDVFIGKHQFKIGIIDFNNNGIFNEPSIDQFFIAPYQSEMTLIQDDNPWIENIGEHNIFKINNQPYQLISIEPNGHTVNLKKLTVPIENKLVKIDAILNINTAFELIDLDNKPIQSGDLFNNKPLYLEFWFNGCSGCIKSFKYLQALEEKDFDMVGVNAIDELAVIQSFNTYYGFDFNHYEIDENLMQRIGNMGVYPSAIKYDENGLLVDQFYNFPYKTETIE